ncbi:MAG: hypothetical protein ACR2IA_01765 [Pyrinomonadaceae bacterium]
MKRKMEITFETEETITLRQVSETLTVFCRRCRTSVEMITPPLAAALAGLSEREIFRLIETGSIHFLEAERIFVCRESLQNRSEPLALADWAED